MHRITYTTRQIADADLPTVRGPDGTLRPASHQDLLNLGLKPLGGGYYACAEQERSEGPNAITVDPATGQVRRHYTPHGPPLPGTIVARGNPAQRHAALPGHVRAPHVHHWHGERHPPVVAPLPALVTAAPDDTETPAT